MPYALFPVSMWHSLTLHGTRFDGASTVLDARCQADGVSFANAHLVDLRLDWGKFNDCDFSGADLSGTSFSEGELENAKFKNAILYGATLSYANAKGADF